MSIDRIKKALQESAETKLKVAKELSEEIFEISNLAVESLNKGKKIMFCGNGGSAADSQHLATELVVRLSGNLDRPAMKAMALTTDTSIITACANDYGFENIFSRQIEAVGEVNDMLIAISTSGNSENIINAVRAALKKGIITVGFLGSEGGKLKDLVAHPLIIPSNDTARIQECHITIGHIMIDLIETKLF